MVLEVTTSPLPKDAQTIRSGHHPTAAPQYILPEGGEVAPTTSQIQYLDLVSALNRQE